MKSFFRILTISFGFICFSMHASSETSLSDSIRTAIEYQRNNYPASQYRDVYKNFMQDFFGPGHILTDTIAAANYLKRELAETEVFDGPLYEPTGFRGNFYRVNLGLIKDGIVPYDVFFKAFVNSVENVTPPEASFWLKLWAKIDQEIRSMNWSFQNEQIDRNDLNKQFMNGNFIVHHSKAYNDAVNFHYRIISRSNFEHYICPYLNSDM